MAASISFKDWVVDFQGRTSYGVGMSPLERLPTELLNRIILFVAAPVPDRGWKTLYALPGASFHRPAWLLACLQVSARLHDTAILIMYRDLTIRAVKTSITRFFETLQQRPRLASLVRTIDITRSVYSDCTISHRELALLPRLRDLRLSLSQVKEVKMLHELIFCTPSLESLTLDISRLNEKTQMLRGVFDGLFHDLSSNLTTLNLTDSKGAGGLDIPGVFESLLPKMYKLQVLNASRTCITVDALSAIPSSARLSYLNIWGCRDLALSRLIDFLGTHPAVASSLVVLKAGDIADTAPLSETQVNSILAHAPKTLRSLDLSRSRMGRSNIPQLQLLCCQLEELSLGRRLRMRDVEDMLLRPVYAFQDECHVSSSSQEYAPEAGKHEALLEPMRNAIALCKLRRRLASVCLDENNRKTAGSLTLRYLDISSLAMEEQGQVKQSILLGSHTRPLLAIELADIPWEDRGLVGNACCAAGWTGKWEGKKLRVERI
ncbi:Leucine Rich Repeat domain protein [Diplocarpon rosae]|nr:Leucine Rich Repeat domain protein [Diplocarpon rosae]